MDTHDTALEKYRNWKLNDPEFSNEEKRYGRPVPSRAYILECINNIPALTLNDLIDYWKITSHYEQDALINRINAMIQAQTLYITAKQTIAVTDLNREIKGSITGHGEGHGFLYPENGGEQLFISPEQMKNYMHGDYVKAKISNVDYKGRREATILELLERKISQIVGRVQIENGNQVLVPENRRIFQHLLLTDLNGFTLKKGQIIIGKLLTPPSKQTLPTAQVTQILGDELTPNIAIQVALFNHNVPHVWPQEVHQETDALSDEVLESDKKDRLDLRNINLVTIDGITARDFDDAVYCEKHDDHFRLLVAIADVSHYVKVGSPLDQEAQSRGTSVYFPDRVVPMLPEKLSNGLCSLNPEVDRLCMVCEMKINFSGEIISYVFHNGLMRSAARLTYDTVYLLLQGDEVLRKAYQKLTPHLDLLYELYKVLKITRDKRGSINFETEETVIEYDAEGNIERIAPSERNDAHMLIEECMIAANICAAAYLEKHKMPTLFRVHPRPPEQRLNKLRLFLKEFNLGLRGGLEPSPGDFAECLAAAEKLPTFSMIQTVMLRSLSQAVYQPANEGHFGLALTQYAHFTSPIRRYPDLLVHRGIKHLLNNGNADNFTYDMPKMAQLGESCSFAERRADEATREVLEWLKCQYMTDKIGKIYEGRITGVTHFGLFVELKDIFVEGLVHISSLPGEYFNFDADRHLLIGERSGKIYRLGDMVKIKVIDANPENRKIDFEILAFTKAANTDKDSKKAEKTITKSRDKNNRNAKISGKNSRKDENKLSHSRTSSRNSTSENFGESRNTRSRITKKNLLERNIRTGTARTADGKILVDSNTANPPKTKKVVDLIDPSTGGKPKKAFKLKIAEKIATSKARNKKRGKNNNNKHIADKKASRTTKRR